MVNRPQPSVPEEGRSDPAELKASPHAVVADVAGLDDARALIEQLELNDIPPGSISLVGAHGKDPRHEEKASDVAESKAFADVAKSTILGGSIGILMGSVLGLLMAYLIQDLSWFWGAFVGGLFGAGAGGAAGGMSIAKYSSPAWDETYQVEEDRQIQVAVHHRERSVVDRSDEVMRGHVGDRVTRLDS